MRVLPINNPDELGEVAETILRNSLRDPQADQLIEALIADPEVTRLQLVHTAFAMGAAAALGEVIQRSGP
jgi:hypothetical protein